MGNVDVIEPGTILGGKYQVERVLGQGGMGVVVAARHLRLDELVAIKFLLPSAATNPQTVERFAREARTASKIKSEHVARVTDVDVTADGATYMVMEFLEGIDLAKLIESRGSLKVEEAVGYVLQVCEAMAEAHSLGIIHRDLKPDNMFLAQRAGVPDSVKVLDFGISKVVGPMARGDASTQTQTIIGSPYYMSPEQLVASGAVDARTDIWAVGVSLYEMLTGALPFHGDTLPSTCTLVMHTAPETLRARKATVPTELEDIVMRCLEKDRAARFPSMGELATALLPFGPPEAERWAHRAASFAAIPPGRESMPQIISQRFPGAPPSRPEADTRANVATLEATSINPERRTPKSRFIFAGIAAVGLLAAGAVASLSSRSASTTRAEHSGHAVAPTSAPQAGVVEAPVMVTPASAEPSTEMASASAVGSVSAAPSASSGASAGSPTAEVAGPPRTEGRWAPPKPTASAPSAPTAVEDSIGF